MAHWSWKSVAALWIFVFRWWLWFWWRPRHALAFQQCRSFSPTQWKVGCDCCSKEASTTYTFHQRVYQKVSLLETAAWLGNGMYWTCCDCITVAALMLLRMINLLTFYFCFSLLWIMTMTILSTRHLIGHCCCSFWSKNLRRKRM